MLPTSLPARRAEVRTGTGHFHVGIRSTSKRRQGPNDMSFSIPQTGWFLIRGPKSHRTY